MEDGIGTFAAEDDPWGDSFVEEFGRFLGSVGRAAEKDHQYVRRRWVVDSKKIGESDKDGTMSEK